MVDLPLAEVTALDLDRTTGGPLFRQVYAGLREAILAGRFAPGMKLPATRAFAALLKVSRNTLVGAYACLSDEGFIETRHGSGS